MDSSILLRELDLVLWTVANVATLINSVITLRNALDKRIDKTQRQANLAWSLYFLSMFIANTLNIVWRLYVLDLYGPDAALLVEKISMLMLNCGWLIIIGYFDLRMKMLDRPYFLYAIATSLIVSLITSFHSGGWLEIVYFIITAIGFSLFPLLFIYMGRKSEGEFRKNSHRIAAGAIIFGLGLFLQVQNVEPFAPQVVEFFDNQIGIPYFVVSPIFIFISMVLLCLGIWKIYLVNIEFEEAA